jgi:hypothetical protein
MILMVIVQLIKLCILLKIKAETELNFKIL